MSQSFIFAHSPDPDDAFMFYGFHKQAAGIPGYTLEHYLADIQSLNEDAKIGKYPITAVSAYAYSELSSTYRILRCGASMGLGYGPIVVARAGTKTISAGGKIGVPGPRTTAFLTMQLWRNDLVPVQIPFDRIMSAVLSGEVDYGLLIHEGQLTWKDQALTKLFDLGEWWRGETGLPLPLGVDVVRRDLGEETCRLLSDAFSASIAYAFDHEEEAMEYARQWGRGISKEVNREFVLMYVNRLTLDMADEGRNALSALYTKAHAAGLIAAVPELDIV